MALPVTITGINNTVACVGPFKVAAGNYADVGIDTNVSGTADSNLTGTGTSTSIGQSFTNGGSSITIPSIIVYMSKTGTPTGFVYVEITSTDPSGTVLATSNQVDVSTITATTYAFAQAITFTFSSPPTIGASATFGVRIWRTVADASNYPKAVIGGTYAGGAYWTYNGTTWGSSANDLDIIINKQFTIASDRYYFFGRDGTTATTLQAFKSTAPDTSWASIATKTGFVTAIAGLSGCQVGHLFHLVVSDGTVATSLNHKYQVFDASTETFTTAETIASALATAGQSGAGRPNASIVVRSTGEPVAFFNGAQVKTSGTFYARVYYSRRTGTATWSAGVQVDASTAADNYNGIAVLGAADRIHLLWFGGTINLQRHLTNANVLGTQSTTLSTSNVTTDAVTINDSGTIRIVGLNAIGTFRFTSADNPTISTNTTTTLGTIPARGVDDNLITYAMYRDSASSDLFLRSSSDFGATWGTAVTAFVGTVTGTDVQVSRNQHAYQRGTDVIFPYIVNDNGTLKYNEYFIRTNIPTLADAWSAVDKANINLTNSDKTATAAGGTGYVRSTTARTNATAGKYYAEFLCTTAGAHVGVCQTAIAISATTDAAYAVISSGDIVRNGTTVGSYGSACANGDALCMAWDTGAELIWFRKNGGLWNNDAAANPATGTNGIDVSALTNVNFSLRFVGTSGAVNTVRTEFADHSYLAPAGFESWMGEAKLYADKRDFSITGSDVGLPFVTPWTPFKVDLTYTQLIEDTTANSAHYVIRDILPYCIKGDSYLFCLEYKPTGPTPRGIALVTQSQADGGGNFVIYANTAGGEYTYGVSGSIWTLDQHSVTATSNGYFKALIRGTYTGGTAPTSTGQMIVYLTANNLLTYNGDGNSGVLYRNYKGLHYTNMPAANSSYGITGKDVTFSKSTAPKKLTANTGTFSILTTGVVAPTLYNVLDLLSCSRASTGYAKTRDGMLMQFPTNTLRVTDLGLLVEEARTNAVSYSQAFESLQVFASTVMTNNIIAPDGTMTADRLTENTDANSRHFIYLFAASGVTAGQNVTVSCYAKDGTRRYFALECHSGGIDYACVVFDLQNGTITDTFEAGGGDVVSSSMEPLGNGWWRCIMTYVHQSAVSADYLGVCLSNSPTPAYSAGAPSYTGDGSSYLYIWGVQSEVGVTFPSSYIFVPSNVGVTRAADVIALTGVASNTLDSSAASVVMSMGTLPPLVSQYELISDASGPTIPLITVDKTQMGIYSSGNFFNKTGLNDITVNASRFGSSWNKTGGRSVTGQGLAPATDAVAVGSLSAATLGNRSGVYGIYSYVRRLTEWNTRLSDTSLQEFTLPDVTIDLKFATNQYYDGIELVNVTKLLSCSRASTGYAQTGAGTMIQFGVNQLRLTDLGLLIEGARTNICLYTQTMSAGAWVQNFAVMTTAGGIAPEGIWTANKLTEDTTATTYHRTYQYFTMSSAVAHTASGYVKYGGRRYLTIYFGDASAWGWIITIDLTNGSVTQTSGSGTGQTYSIEAMADGWYKFVITINVVNLGSGFLQYLMSDIPTPGSLPQYTGDGTSYVLIWGTNVEVGAFPSSYIPTTSAAATRAADVVTIEGSLKTIVEADVAQSGVADVKTLTVPTVPWSIICDNGGLGHTRLGVYDDNEAFGFKSGVFCGPVTMGSGLYSTGVISGYSQDSSGQSVVAGGGTVATNTDHFAIGGPRLGFPNGVGSQFWGYFRRLSIWNTRLSNTTLQALTVPWRLAGSKADLRFTTNEYYDGSSGSANITTLLSCTRASIGYAQTSDGRLIPFNPNQLRITDLGLLVENTRTNYCPVSVPNEASGLWYPTNVSTTVNATMAPDGTMTATKVTGDSSINAHRFYGYAYQSAASVGEQFSFSAFFKAGTHRYIRWEIANAGGEGGYAGLVLVIDLNTGAITDTYVHSPGVYWSNLSYSLEPFANGWVRAKITMTVVSATTNGILHLLYIHTGPAMDTPAFDATGMTFYVWGVQTEKGAFVSSYIPTTTAAVTRALDSVTFIGALDNALKGAAGSVVLDTKLVGSALNQQNENLYVLVGNYFVLETTYRHLLRTTALDTQVSNYRNPPGASGHFIATIGGGLTLSGGVKVGSSWDTLSGSLVGGGGTVEVANPNMGGSGYTLGYATGQLTMFTYHRRLTVWNTRLSDATLQGLTAP